MIGCFYLIVNCFVIESTCVDDVEIKNGRFSSSRFSDLKT